MVSCYVDVINASQLSWLCFPYWWSKY